MSDSLWTRGIALLACAAVQLTANSSETVTGPPERTFFSPGGPPPWDNCCQEGGQLWVRVVKAHPVNPVPTKVLVEVPCSYPIGVQLGLGIIRCAHTLDDLGNAPTIGEVSKDARQMVCDMAALLRALECCDDIDTRATTLDQWSPLGASGGCHGGEWTFWWAPTIDCPEEGST